MAGRTLSEQEKISIGEEIIGRERKLHGDARIIVRLADDTNEDGMPEVEIVRMTERERAKD